MAYSNYLLPTAINGCDDDGVYYMRQLDARDGVDFEGLVWFGQHATSAPRWANVFVGRLARDVRRDEHENPVDRWEGTFFDVPKGRLCGSSPLVVESLVTPPNPRRAGCDFPEHYLRKVSGRGFGGHTWNIETTVSSCWEDAPPLPRLIRDAIVSDPRTGFQSLVIGLGSAPLPAGFEQSSNLTGTWIGDDGGSYYIRHKPDTDEVAWYAESPNAHPLDNSGSTIVPARGWSNVFIGRRSGATIRGFWADVPRGATRGAGRMRMTVDDGERCIRIDSVTGGYGVVVQRERDSVEG